mgnify:CR=1 FL=1
MGDIVNAMQSAVCVHRYLSTTMSSFPIRSFEQLHHHLAQLPSRCRVAVAHPADAHTLQAVLEAVQLGFVDAFLVGEVYAPLLENLSSEIAAWVHHIPVSDAGAAMQQAVQMVHDGEADVLMKGLVNTDDLLRHVLNKTYGLRQEEESSVMLRLSTCRSWSASCSCRM